jgi:murein DD-endopeptidase MepM/ murein hydrolase activator NlpD
VPRHSPGRPAHARPRRSADVPAALLRPHPLTPLADRDRPRWRTRRTLVVGAAALGIALSIPLAGAALTPAAPQLQPLAGDVAGAITGPHRTPGSSVAPAAAVPIGDPRLRQIRATDADRPLGPNQRGAPAVSTLTGYRWPISVGRITLPFKAIPGGTRIKDGKLFHDGVDMASFCGAPVRAAHDGTVLAAGRRFDDVVGWVGDLTAYYHVLNVRHMWHDLPNVVVIDDGNGYRSIYAHFRDVTVKRGQVVRAGDVIGHEGATGHASGCHVHYGLFSPRETKTFGVRADIIRRLHTPRLEIARIDPLLVLPGGDVALRTRSIAKAIAAARTEAG